MKEWISPAGNIKLERHPFKGEKTHQAWDSADEWIASKLESLLARDEDSVRKKLLITGEAFGVLATLWGRHDVTALNDSLLSFTAAEHNRGLNPKLCRGGFRQVRTTEAQPGTDAQAGAAKQNDDLPELIIMRLPKSLELLEIYLRQSLNFAGPETDIWLGGMEKRWSRGVKNLTDHYLAAGEVYPFERHSRWIRFRRASDTEKLLPAEGSPSEETAAWMLERYPVKVLPAGLVFSSKGLDQGTAAFLAAFPETAVKSAERIADAGCGSGILGLSAAALNPDANIFFTDESFLAVEACSANINLNGWTDRAEAWPANGLDGIEDESLDLVLCNPPFHYQNIQSREPAEFLFKEAARCLKPDGLIQVVGNSHLGYHRLLEKYFTEVKKVYSNSKFQIHRAEVIKR